MGFWEPLRVALKDREIATGGSNIATAEGFDFHWFLHLLLLAEKENC